jgi:hypothetical protein
MAAGGDIERRRASSQAATSDRGEIAAFLAQAHAAPQAGGGGRLVFALDATLSRQPTWDLACEFQGEMFRAARGAGGLEVQLVYFRGLGEARASAWMRDAAGLARAMSGIDCRGGLTQIGRVLGHVAREAARRPVAALAYVGDAMEENVDTLAAKAGELALRGVRAFMFLEGRDPAAETAMREIARITGGVLLPFDRRSAAELRALLGAVAAYAAGGRPALEAAGTGAARRLLCDLRP